jgi:diketogulonate reductase-like aldo/keto reductase
MIEKTISDRSATEKYMAKHAITRDHIQQSDIVCATKVQVSLSWYETIRRAIDQFLKRLKP